MKYEFKEISLDNYELHYIDKNGEEKIIPFKRTVEIAQKLQSADADARFEMLEYLQSKGKTKEDFIIEKHENGKIIRDESNYREFEASFLENKRMELLMELYEILFKKNVADLFLDMNVSEKDSDKVQDFSLELREILINGKTKTPSIQKGDK